MPAVTSNVNYLLDRNEVTSGVKMFIKLNCCLENGVFCPFTVDVHPQVRCVFLANLDCFVLVTLVWFWVLCTIFGGYKIKASKENSLKPILDRMRMFAQFAQMRKVTTRWNVLKKKAIGL